MTIDGEQKKNRPGWVWAISIFFFVSAAWTLLSFYLVNSGAVPLNTAQKAYFDNLTMADYGLTILIGLANLTGAIALVMLRKAAFYLFATALACNLVTTAWQTVTKGWAEAIGGAGLLGALIGLGLLIAVCVYSWKLLQRGILT